MIDKVTDIESAIRHVKTGDSIFVGGFTNFGCPLHLLYELAKHPETKELTLISEDFGYGLPPYMPYSQAQGALMENDQVKEAVVSFVGPNPAVNDAVESGKMKLTLVPQGTLAERIRAGGAGLEVFTLRRELEQLWRREKKVKLSMGKNIYWSFRCGLMSLL